MWSLFPLTLFNKIYVQFCLDLQTNVLTLYKSYCSFVLPSDFRLRFYGCCHPCFIRTIVSKVRDLLGKDQSTRLEVKERPDVGVYVKVSEK